MSSAAVPAIDIPDLLRAVSELDREARALQIDGHWYTWSDLDGGLQALQSTLQEAGLSGEFLPVAVIMRSTASTVAAVLSLLVNRQTLVTLNHMQSSQRLAASIRDAAAAVVVGNPEDWTNETLEATRERGMLGLSVSATDPSKIEVVCEFSMSVDEVEAARRPGIAVSMLTSGTTGPPKRIPLSYQNWSQGIVGGLQFTSAADAQPRLRKGVALHATPLTHAGGVWRIVFTYISGRSLVLLPRFDVDAWVALVREHRPPIVTMPPPVLQMILDAEVAIEALSSLKAIMVGTAPLDPALAERFEDAYGVSVLANYGATEFAGAVASWTLADRQQYRLDKRGSVGRAHPDVELRVVHREDGQPLDPGQVGLLEVKAPQLDNARADGWLRTNDLAEIDADGFIFIRGRADDAIIRGGFKVSAGEIAATLKSHPDLHDVAVVGWPDDRLGEVPVAAVELRDGAVITPDQIREWARENLMAYQVPAHVVLLPELPRSAMMKVDAVALRDLIAQELG